MKENETNIRVLTNERLTELLETKFEKVTKSKGGHGGPREGAGRKRKYNNLPTKTMRVPIEAIPVIERLLDEMYG